MSKNKIHIKVFITKKQRFRAIIIDTATRTYPVEITVGGKNWKEGLYSEYHDKIINKCGKLVNNLTSQLHDIEESYSIT